MLCGSKEFKAFLIKKRFLFFVFFFIFSLFNLYFNPVWFSLSKNFFWIREISSITLRIGVFWGYKNLFFLLIVCLVTSIVFLFRQFYMDHYNNKKFYFLTLSFFISIAILSFRSSNISFILGWDSLGFSSLFLIMFYPGKIPLFNSFITFFFNRLGDCIIIVVCSFLLYDFSNIFSHLIFRHSISPFSRIFILLLLLLCSFTKRAQFPLSSWLPAAMSAPTPISAIVHSSTLVTAGIYLISRVFFYLHLSSFSIFLVFVRCLTFIMGGVLGCLELDLKKIVAFSTIRQISMIIFFIALNFFRVGFEHMFFHALFKTLLFCSCGLIFLGFVSDQNRNSIFGRIESKRFFMMLFIAIFNITGFYFSSSFFSKDFILENLIFNSEFLFFCLLLGSMLTIFYRSKILVSSRRKIHLTWPIFFSKKTRFFYGLVFTLVSLFCCFLTQFFNFVYFNPTISLIEITLISLVLFSVFFLDLNPLKHFFRLRVDLMRSKFFLFRRMRKFFSLESLKLIINDQFFFKPYILSFARKTFNIKLMRHFFYVLVLILILILFIYSFSLNRTWYWSYQSNRIFFIQTLLS